MKKYLLVCALALMLGGCALLDSLFLSRARNSRGEELFTDSRGQLTTHPRDSQGHENEPAYSGAPSEGVNALTGIIQGLGGPWGAAAGAGLGLITAAYAALRNRRQVSAERAKSAAWQGGMATLVSVLEDLKNGAIDADRNGRVSLREIREYVRKRGKEALQPAFVAEVVRIVTSTLAPSEKQRALEEAAAKMA